MNDPDKPMAELNAEAETAREVAEVKWAVGEIAAALADAAQISARVWSRLADLDRRLAALEAAALEPNTVPPGWLAVVTHAAPRLQ